MNDRDDEDLLDKFGLGGTSRDHDEATFTPDTAAPDGLNGWEEILGEQLRGGPAPIFTGNAKHVSGAPFVKKFPHKQRREYLLSFPEVTVQPGCSATVVVRSQMLFHGHKIIATCPDGHDDLLITNCFVGNRVQPLQNTPVAVFSPQSFTNEFVMDTAEPAIDISIVVQNTGTIARRATFTILGYGLG